MEVVNEPMRSIILDVQTYFKNVGIESLTARKIEADYVIDFDLNIDSFVAPDLFNDKPFQFSLHLRPNQSSQITFRLDTVLGSPIPYHPHFKVIDKSGVQDFFTRSIKKVGRWIDYELAPSSIEAFIRKVVLSLQYHKTYIDINASRIGNDKALEWYLKEFHTNDIHKKFPTGHFLEKRFDLKKSADQSSAGPKKFEVLRNTDNHEQPTKTSKKFAINKERKYEIQEKKFPEFEEEQMLHSDCTLSESNARLIITNEARKKIWKHIGWADNDQKNNRVEQGGVLLGHVYKDKSLGIQFGIVDNVVSGHSAVGNSTYLEMNHETWSEMMAEVDEIVDSDPENEVQVIGWYHTHPNQLNVFMSGTDMNTQHNYFNQPWHFAIVLNPHRQIWKAFVGKDAKLCKGIIFNSTESTNDESITNESKVAKPVSKVRQLLEKALTIRFIGALLATLFFLVTVIIVIPEAKRNSALKNRDLERDTIADVSKVDTSLTSNSIVGIEQEAKTDSLIKDSLGSIKKNLDTISSSSD